MNDFLNRANAKYYRIDIASPAHLVSTVDINVLIGKAY